jgi:uncharacterized protein involved in response to NO
MLGAPLGRWWQAAAQVHAHAFVFGWAGLMVPGVGFHFLPRLRGRPLDDTGWTRVVLWLLISGLVLRALSQPASAAALDPTLATLARLALSLSALLELVGASVAVAVLARMLPGRPSLSSRRPLGEVLPFLAVAFSSLWLALALNLAAIVQGVENGVLAGQAYRVCLLLGVYGFLVPVSVGVGARLFPLHFAAALPSLGLLRAGLWLLVGGLALRTAGEVSDAPAVAAVGLVGLAGALGLFVVGSRVFGGRRIVPGGREAWYTDAAQWHGLVAFACLGLTSVLLAAGALSIALPGRLNVALRAEWHLLGLGFVTLLIFGEAAKLLPGFARRPLRSDALVWTTLILLVLAATLRIGPVLLPLSFPDLIGRLALAGSGLLGMLAALALGLNVYWPARQEPDERTSR